MEGHIGGVYMGIFIYLFAMAMFIVSVGFSIIVLVKGFSTKKKNDNAPRITVEAKVVTKRVNVSHYHNGTGTDMNYSGKYSRYYVTFEVESGDRMELCVTGSDYGMLVEGDMGKLTFQGTRYLGFERK